MLAVARVPPSPTTLANLVVCSNAFLSLFSASTQYAFPTLLSKNMMFLTTMQPGDTYRFTYTLIINNFKALDQE
jgi:hypothetical protein